MLEILILCTGNSARSILAEALFNTIGDGRIRAHSAGSRPKGEPHPMALDLLHRRGHDTAALHSKSWDVFAGPDAPHLDAVITVCDSAAAETCPVWPGAPARAHWGLPDPAGIADRQAERQAFDATYAELERRVAHVIDALAECGDDAVPPQRLQAILRSAHTNPGAPE